MNQQNHQFVDRDTFYCKNLEAQNAEKVQQHMSGNMINNNVRNGPVMCKSSYKHSTR